MRLLNTLALLAFALPSLALPSTNEEKRAPAPAPIAAAAPADVAPMSPRTFGPWSKWNGPSACTDSQKAKHCFDIGSDCNEQCVCVPWDGCGWGAKFWCKIEHGYLDNHCDCQKPSHKPRSEAQWRKRSAITCPSGFSACPIDPSAKKVSIECLDTRSSIDSCGGCVSEGLGADCSAIPGVRDVSCESGACKVFSCERGYRVENGTTCVETEQNLVTGASFMVGEALRGAEKFWGH